MEEEEVGKVQKFFAKPSVAAVEVTDGALKLGDRLHFKGHTTDFEETLKSMEIDNRPVNEAKPGDLLGIKVRERVREHDKVYKILSG